MERKKRGMKEIGESSRKEEEREEIKQQSSNRCSNEHRKLVKFEWKKSKLTWTCPNWWIPEDNSFMNFWKKRCSSSAKLPLYLNLTLQIIRESSLMATRQSVETTYGKFCPSLRVQISATGRNKKFSSS